MNPNRMQWLMPVISTLWEAEVGGPQGQGFKTNLANMDSNLKTYKNWPRMVACACNPSYLGG